MATVQLSTIRTRATNRILFRNTNSLVLIMKSKIFKIKREECFVMFKTSENKHAMLLIYALIFKNAQH